MSEIQKSHNVSSELLSLERKIGNDRGEFVGHPARAFLIKHNKGEGESKEELRTFRVPNSQVLAEAKNFLPQIAQADAKLTEEMVCQDLSEFDVENVDGAEEYVEMNVALVELNDTDTDSETENVCESASSSDSENEEDGEEAAERKTSNIGMYLSDTNYRAPVKLCRKVELMN